MVELSPRYECRAMALQIWSAEFKGTWSDDGGKCWEQGFGDNRQAAVTTMVAITL
jgi:hypothetical protein